MNHFFISCCGASSRVHAPREDVGNGNLIGSARSRCEHGSRWVGYTFLTRDVGRPVKVPGALSVVRTVAARLSPVPAR